jgi:hypothetical protein
MRWFRRTCVAPSPGKSSVAVTHSTASWPLAALCVFCTFWASTCVITCTVHFGAEPFWHKEDYLVLWPASTKKEGPYVHMLWRMVSSGMLRLNIAEDTILHSHRRENLKSYIHMLCYKFSWRGCICVVYWKLFIRKYLIIPNINSYVMY